VTFTQILGLTVGLLAAAALSHLVRSTATRQKRSVVNFDVGFRRVGTFGRLAHFPSDTSPRPCTGSSGRAVLVMLVLAVFSRPG